MLSGASQADALQLALEFGINLRCKDRTWKLPLALNKSPLSTAKNIVRQLFVLPTSWVLILNHLVLRLQMSWRLLLRSLPVRNGKNIRGPGQMQHFIGLRPFCGVKGLIWQQLYQLSSRLWEMPVRSDSYHVIRVEFHQKKAKQLNFETSGHFELRWHTGTFSDSNVVLACKVQHNSNLSNLKMSWCHSLSFRFFWWAPCQAENLCRALGRNPAFCEAVLASTLWQRLGSGLKQVQELTTSPSLSHAKFNFQLVCNPSPEI